MSSDLKSILANAEQYRDYMKRVKHLQESRETRIYGGVDAQDNEALLTLIIELGARVTVLEKLLDVPPEGE